MINGILDSLKTVTNTIRITKALSGQPDIDLGAVVQDQLNDSTKIETQTKKLQEKTVSVNIERHIYTEKPKNAEQGKTRLNVFYTLPGEINGYSFIEFENGEVFNRNILGKSLGYSVSARTDIKIFSDKKSRIGIGLGYNTTGKQVNIGGTVFEELSAGVRILPLWYDANGKVPFQSTAVVSAGAKLKLSDELNLKIGGFLDMNFDTKGNGAKAVYGEIGAEVIYKNKFGLGFGANLKPKKGPNSLIPNANFRATAKYHF